MRFANDTYGVTETQCHIVGRKEGALVVFNAPCDETSIDSICDVVDKEAAISFNDGISEYSFSKSKSVLFKKFEVPCECKEIPVAILEEPLELLAAFLADKELHANAAAAQQHFQEAKDRDYAILRDTALEGDAPMFLKEAG